MVVKAWQQQIRHAGILLLSLNKLVNFASQMRTWNQVRARSGSVKEKDKKGKRENESGKWEGEQAHMINLSALKILTY